MMTPLFQKVRWLLHRRSKEEELREELQFHLDEEAEERQAEGLTGEEARLAARREIGNLALVQEETRAAWTWMQLEQIAQDCRYGFRAMAANRSFSLLAVLSLALGIGANTAIYSFMDALLLRSLPVRDPQSLVMLSWRTPNNAFNGSSRHDESYRDPKGGYVGGIVSYPAFELFRKYDSVFTHVFGYQSAGRLNLMYRGEAELADTEYVSGEYFEALGIPPAAGRLIAPDDDRAGGPAVAVVSFGLSERRFGGAGNAPGQSILISNIPFTVIGVAPPEFFGADPASAPDIYIPMHASLLLQAGDRLHPPERNYIAPTYDWVVPMARLRPGVSAMQAQAALAGPFFEWARAADPKRRVEDTPRLFIREGAGGLDSLRRQFSKPLYVLLALVGLILAIACANIANLLLARAAARRREIAVRLSIGAGRRRVIRQLMTESVLLSLTGGALGVGFAVWGIRVLTLLLANGRENFTLRAELNWHVLGAAVGLSVLTGLVFGLAPALQSTRMDVMPALKEARASQPGSRHSFRRASLGQMLVATQIGISLLMLVAAGLFVRTLWNLQSIQLGFNRENVLLFQINARKAGHKDPEITTFYGDLRKRLGAIPGVREASASHCPLLGEGTSATGVVPVGQQRKNSTHILMVAPDFFATMQIPVLVGREFNERDRQGSPAVAIVSEAYVKTNFGDQNPLGRHVTISRGPLGNREAEIVGVAGNVRYGRLKGDFRDIAYFPFDQGSYVPVNEMTFALRTSGDPLRYAGTVREIVRQADSHIPVTDMKTQAGQIDQVMNQEIIFARLCTAFAILALLIVCVGLYGTMSYTVARRTSEIGIRMALGAQRGAVVWMVLRQAFVLAMAGLAIGVPTALGISRLVESFLFGVKPNSPAALAVAASILLGAVILAGYVPARKASRIDPMTAVRHE